MALIAVLVQPTGPLAAAGLELGCLTASDAAAGDRFGEALAAEGETLVVGARRSDVGGLDAGAAYVFERDPLTGGWTETARLAAPDAGSGDLFGAAVAVDGDAVAVGAPFAGDLDLAGAVYVFERDLGGPGAWGLAARLTAPDAAAGDQLGSAVALAGSTLLAGAPFDSDAGFAAGSAWRFERAPGGGWAAVGKLTASDAATDDRFGGAVALAGDRALVGAENEDAGGLDAGAAYLFERDAGGPGAWGEVAKLGASDAAGNDRFGHAVALGRGGERAVVGAHWHDEAGSNAGAAYVFEPDGLGGWIEAAELHASQPQVGAWFGRAVAAGGDLVVAGAELEDAGAGDSGAAYVFRAAPAPGEGWEEVAHLVAMEGAGQDALGRAVAVTGNTVAAGAPEDDDLGAGAGSVVLFRADAVELAVGGACPGEISVEIAGATPGGTAFVGWAARAGGSVLPSGPCAGTALGLERPRLLVRLTLDGEGGASVARSVADAACGVLLQVVDGGTCATSAAAAIPGGD